MGPSVSFAPLQKQQPWDSTPLFKIFRPKDRVFFYHFEASAANVLKMSEDLVAIMNTEPGAQRIAMLERLELAEHANDDLTHTIFTDLARNFITPIDREDIHELATSLDDVADFILASAKNLELLRYPHAGRDLPGTGPLGERGQRDRAAGRADLAYHVQNAYLKTEFVVRINSMENEADEVFDRGIQRLFANEKDPIMLMRKRVIYVHLELATDKTEDVGNVLESIMLKYA